MDAMQRSKLSVVLDEFSLFELQDVSNMVAERLKKFGILPVSVAPIAPSGAGGLTARDFKVGDIVTFFSKRAGKTVVGRVTKVNVVNISITESISGQKWRVGPSLLNKTLTAAAAAAAAIAPAEEMDKDDDYPDWVSPKNIDSAPTPSPTPTGHIPTSEGAGSW